jgi:putative flippase GtrA
MKTFMLTTSSRIFDEIPNSLKKFLVSGVSTVMVDSIVYFTLLYLGLNIDLSKVLGLIAATIFAYFINRFWTFNDFSSKSNNISLFLILYLTASSINVIVNHIIIDFYHNFTLVLPAAWLVSTLTSATINYLGMRFWVFPKNYNNNSKD